jgi:hypothetical protein
MTTSLESAIKTLKVNTGSAPRLESERYIGSGEFKTCFTWDGRDLIGRRISPDSFYTKSPGCHSATDRILVENQISRPRYYTYIALSPYGLMTGGSDYDSMNPETYQSPQWTDYAQPYYVSPYTKQYGFGTAINSAISATIPEDRLLRAQEIYSGQFL